MGLRIESMLMFGYLKRQSSRGETEMVFNIVKEERTGIKCESSFPGNLGPSLYQVPPQLLVNKDLVSSDPITHLVSLHPPCSPYESLWLMKLSLLCEICLNSTIAIPEISSNPVLFVLLSHLYLLKRPNKANTPDALFMLQLSLELIKLIVISYKQSIGLSLTASVDSK